MTLATYARGRYITNMDDAMDDRDYGQMTMAVEALIEAAESDPSILDYEDHCMDIVHEFISSPSEVCDAIECAADMLGV